MIEQTSQSLGTIHSDLERDHLGRDMYQGRIVSPDGTERLCVIRFLAQSEGDLGRRRFVNEALISLDVTRDHSNLLSTLHFGVWQDGRLFMAMEQLDGRAVSQLTERLFGQFAEIGAIARGALHALAYLHSRGVTHGNVRAGNIMIGSDGVIRLGDFSQAKRPREDGALGDRNRGVEDLRALGQMLFRLVANAPASIIGTGGPMAHLPEDTPPELAELISALLDDESPDGARSGAASLLVSHKWLAASGPLTGLLPTAYLEEPAADPPDSAAVLGVLDSSSPSVSPDASSEPLEQGDSNEAFDDGVEALIRRMVDEFYRMLERHVSEDHGDDKIPVLKARFSRWMVATTAVAVLAVTLALYGLIRPLPPPVVSITQAPGEQPASVSSGLVVEELVKLKRADTVQAPAKPEVGGNAAVESEQARSAVGPKKSTAPVGVKNGTSLGKSKRQATTSQKLDNKSSLAEEITQRSERPSISRMSGATANSSGVQLSVERGLRVGHMGRLWTSVFNGDESPFQVVSFKLHGEDESGNYVTLHWSSSTGEQGCSADGLVSPQTRCKFRIDVERFDELTGQSLTLIVNDMDRAHRIELKGLSWR